MALALFERMVARTGFLEALNSKVTSAMFLSADPRAVDLFGRTMGKP